RSGFLQNEVREVLEYPFVFQRVIDNSEKFAGQGDDGPAGSSPAANSLVVVSKIGAVAFGDERTLHQRRSTQLAASLRDVSRTLCLIRVVHARHDAEVGSQPAL